MCTHTDAHVLISTIWVKSAAWIYREISVKSIFWTFGYHLFYECIEFYVLKQQANKKKLRDSTQSTDKCKWETENKEECDDDKQ